MVDDATYTAKIGGRTLDLTFKEFELLKYLAQHPGRVFSRQQLLQEVWGYDYFGGTRTVDVHVRRLRAKLGPEHETLIGTVRNVGYRFVLPTKDEQPQRCPTDRPPEQQSERDGTPTGWRARQQLASGLGTYAGRRDRDRRDAARPTRSKRSAMRCLAGDGIDPLDEATDLRLRNHGLAGEDRLWLHGDDGFLLALADDASTSGSTSRWPSARTLAAQGTGRRLLAECLASADDADAECFAWSHGDHPAAAALAERRVSTGHGHSG